MPKKKNKYYVVWEGRKPGIYSGWDDCKAQIFGYNGAKYKGFPNKTEAEKAFSESYKKYLGKDKKTGIAKLKKSREKIDMNSIAVDAACSGNPGDMEYRGVITKTGTEIFRIGPYKQGTNNIGEFLALVHALALLKKQNKNDIVIYTDSVTAMSWVRNKKVKTKLKKNRHNEKIFDLIERALIWLDNNSWENPIKKWDTGRLGEIPADFGRK